MVRRYLRDCVEMFERRDVAFRDFPSGRGPPIHLTTTRGEWQRLAYGQADTIRLDGSEGGAFAWGLVKTVAVVWIYAATDVQAVAYCYHAPGGPPSAIAHETALRAVGCGAGGFDNLYVFLASRREITEEEERFFLLQGVRSSRLHTYTNCFVPQFGVSARGCVGEAT